VFLKNKKIEHNLNRTNNSFPKRLGTHKAISAKLYLFIIQTKSIYTTLPVSMKISRMNHRYWKIISVSIYHY